jgi:putative oxidoreductase
MTSSIMSKITLSAAPSATHKGLSLLFLRVAMGFLLIWWGLNKIVSVGLATTISDNFYGGLFTSAPVQYAFGAFQTVIGICVVLGFRRAIVLPTQAAINGFTAMALWYAIIDPFKWYLSAQTDFPFTQLFYPSIIIFAAALVLLVFRDMDCYALDNRRVYQQRSARRPAASLERPVP